MVFLRDVSPCIPRKYLSRGVLNLSGQLTILYYYCCNFMEFISLVKICFFPLFKFTRSLEIIKSRNDPSQLPKPSMFCSFQYSTSSLTFVALWFLQGSKLRGLSPLWNQLVMVLLSLISLLYYGGQPPERVAVRRPRAYCTNFYFDKKPDITLKFAI